MSNSKVKHIDLDDLDILRKKGVCDLLDEDDQWKTLAELMGFSISEIKAINNYARRRYISTSDALISRWSNLYGHNVTELFKLLSDMKQVKAMKILADLVDSRYHIWFPKNDKSDSDSSEKMIREKLKNHPNLCDINELQKATDNWSEQRVIGKGGFGKVYIGEWLHTNVAIKRIKIERKDSKTLDSSLTELRCLIEYRHDNILPVYGFTVKGDYCCIVTELLSGGSLDERLSRKKGYPPLNWWHRFMIALGSARGINFLHSYNPEKPLIHGDIKPGNIFLNEHLVPKIGDFGLSREGLKNDENIQVSRVYGTRPYLPSEVYGKNFSTKVDVFSFGVVLFEIPTNLKSYDKDRPELFLYNHMKTINESSTAALKSVIDASIQHDVPDIKFCSLLIKIGKQCTDPDPKKRPDMDKIYTAIKTFNPNEYQLVEDFLDHKRVSVSEEQVGSERSSVTA